MSPSFRRWTVPDALRDAPRLLWLSARSLGGRRFWLVVLFPLVWPAFQLLRLLVQWRDRDFTAEEVSGLLIGFPLAVLALGLGVRIIAGEIDRRTLEIAYTVPGGAARVWLSKLAAAVALLLIAAVLMAIAVFVFLTPFPVSMLYGALQGAIFYLVVAMGLSVLFKSEATGALVAVGVLVTNGVFTGFGTQQMRLSPFFNPWALEDDPRDVLAWTVQNRLFFLLLIAAIVALAFVRAERRERMLSG